jgi:hypothetical protein
MNHLRDLWREAGQIDEDNPSFADVIAAFAVFVMGLLVVFFYILLFAPELA